MPKNEYLTCSNKSAVPTSDWDADIGAGGDGANNGNVQWVGGSFYGVEHGNEGKA
jgi:hypothetical protein